jgi:Protein of unknown function (DUF3659)
MDAFSSELFQALLTTIQVDADGDVLDKNGNVLGKAERYQEEEEVPEVPEEEDLSIL